MMYHVFLFCFTNAIEINWHNSFELFLYAGTALDNAILIN